MAEEFPVLDELFNKTRDDKSRLSEILKRQTLANLLVADVRIVDTRKGFEGNKHTYLYFGEYRGHDTKELILGGGVHNTHFFNGKYSGHGSSRYDSDGDQKIRLGEIERLYTPHKEISLQEPSQFS